MFKLQETGASSMVTEKRFSFSRLMARKLGAAKRLEPSCRADDTVLLKWLELDGSAIRVLKMELKWD